MLGLHQSDAVGGANSQSLSVDKASALREAVSELGSQIRGIKQIHATGVSELKHEVSARSSGNVE